MSFRRRNTDWQAYGQHRRRGTAYFLKRQRERVEDYQAGFKQPEAGKREQDKEQEK
ncbi:hypothetical protein [Neisseria perflava]|uniref:hypothetical protein n=1 Tax=Neisseria perflava TaxID=33053 RepID=UPI0020A0C54C|nr:hypothetical protein [Neisseria perflava]MCP1659306.1 hypothetical protein [Neisseria perflava]MCP1772891.1 hypothetical protein [Neisseria perflava]